MVCVAEDVDSGVRAVGRRQGLAQGTVELDAGEDVACGLCAVPGPVEGHECGAAVRVEQYVQRGCVSLATGCQLWSAWMGMDDGDGLPETSAAAGYAPGHMSCR